MEKKDMTAKIAAWKKKHGDVFAYEVDGKTCYLHRPGRDVIAAAGPVQVRRSHPVELLARRR